MQKGGVHRGRWNAEPEDSEYGSFRNPLNLARKSDEPRKLYVTQFHLGYSARYSIKFF
jgi:hypothetical protein